MITCDYCRRGDRRMGCFRAGLCYENHSPPDGTQRLVHLCGECAEAFGKRAMAMLDEGKPREVVVVREQTRLAEWGKLATVFFAGLFGAIGGALGVAVMSLIGRF